MTGSILLGRDRSLATHPAADSLTITPSGGDPLRSFGQVGPTYPSGVRPSHYSYVQPYGSESLMIVVSVEPASYPRFHVPASDPLVASALIMPSLLQQQIDRGTVGNPAEENSSGLAESGNDGNGTQATEGEPVLAEQLVDAIQDTLSLSVTQLADVLGVSRATVHAWARGQILIPRDPRVAQRLRDIRDVGESWRQRSGADLGRLVAAPLAEGQPSLLDLLRASEWDKERIDRTLEVLANQLEARHAKRKEARAALGERTGEHPNADTVELERQRSRALLRRGRYYGR